MKSNLYQYRREQGYVLLVMLLFVTLLSIGFLAMIERIDFQIKRDREEEFIHRGLEYSRAVRKYVKKFGRYPNTVEELENTNNVRFLRKRYKDPITGKDFKILHYGDLETFYASTPPVPAAGIPTPPPGAPIARNRTAAPPEGPRPSDAADSSPAGDPSDPSQPDPSATGESEPPPPSEQTGSDAALEAAGPAVIGVTSYAKDKTIRVFNKKDHYNQWQFVYDPSTDHVGLMTSPNRPLLKAAVQAEPQNGPGSAQDSRMNRGQTNPTPTPGAQPPMQH